MNHICSSDGEEYNHSSLPIVSPTQKLVEGRHFAGVVSRLIQREGERASRRFVEFFAATIRNPNTRAAYAQAIGQFLAWCERGSMTLHTISPIAVASYIEQLGEHRSIPTVKQHLAAIRMCFDWLVSGHVLTVNPAWSVRGPRYSMKRGKTPVLTAAEARQLIDSIDITTIIGLRDRALIGVMAYTFARVSAVVHMNVEDYYTIGKRAWIRLHEKGGKHHDVPAHHRASEYLDEYIDKINIAAAKKTPLFRSMKPIAAARQAREPEDARVHKSSVARSQAYVVTEHRMSRMDVLRMIKRRASAVGIDASKICCHTFRATGITAYLENGGTLEHAQAIAAHESPRTTKLYDRTADSITLDEVERIAI